MASQEQSPKSTIEKRGAELASRQAQRMRSGEERTYPFIKIKNQAVLDFPRISNGTEYGVPRRRLQEDVHFDPETGAIYTTKWDSMPTALVDEGTDKVKRAVVFPKNKIPEMYTFIARNDDAEVYDPEDLPRSGVPIELVVNQVWDGLEPAIRQQHHILKEYNPIDPNAEPQKMRRLMHWIDRTARELSAGQVERTRLEELSTEATALIDITGLPHAQDATKQKIATMLQNAPTPDSLGRVNPMVARTRLRSALLASTRRVVTAELVRQKFNANVEVLTAERVFTRFDVESSLSELDLLSPVARQLELDPTQITRQEREELVADVTAVAVNHLRFPRVAPYLLPSRLAAIYLVGVRPEKEESNRRVLGNETADDVFATPPAVTLLKSEDEEDQRAAGSTIRWAHSILDDALHLEEHNNITPTPKR
jgi:hypothetical protein